MSTITRYQPIINDPPKFLAEELCSSPTSQQGTRCLNQFSANRSLVGLRQLPSCFLSCNLSGVLGHTFLSYALQFHLEDCVEHLLEQDPQLVNRGWGPKRTPYLVEAVRSYDPKNPSFSYRMVTLFIKKGADVNLADAEGRTALFESSSIPNQRLDTNLQAADYPVRLKCMEQISLFLMRQGGVIYQKALSIFARNHPSLRNRIFVYKCQIERLFSAHQRAKDYFSAGIKTALVFQSEMAQAVIRNSPDQALAIIQKLHAEGKDINEVDDFGATALFYSSMLDTTQKVTHYLIKNGGVLYIEALIPLFEKVFSKNKEWLPILAGQGDRIAAALLIE
jgi:ankyrin repeat protein